MYVRTSVLCECGARIQPKNLIAHQQSVLHRQNIAVQTKANGQGNIDPLVECPCGAYIRASKRKQHKDGDNHRKYYQMRADNFPTCSTCNLPYDASDMEGHSMTSAHVRGAIAKEEFILQRARTRVPIN